MHGVIPPPRPTRRSSRRWDTLSALAMALAPVLLLLLGGAAHARGWPRLGDIEWMIVRVEPPPF